MSKQKQKQEQKVIINIDTKRKKRQKRRQQMHSKQDIQPRIVQPQSNLAIPSLLGLQTANNAQLLTSLSNTINTMFKAHANKTPEFSRAVSTTTPIETPPQQNALATAAPPQAPPQAPQLIPPQPPSRPRRTTATLPPQPPSESEIEIVPQRRRKKLLIEESENTVLAEQIPTTRKKIDIDNLNVEFNQNGTVKKRGLKWAALSPEQQQAIRDEEALTRPVKAKKVVDEPEQIDEELSQGVRLTRTNKPSPSGFTSTTIPTEQEKPKGSLLNLLKPTYAKVAPFEGVEELQPETRQKPEAFKQDTSLLKRTKPEPIAVMGDTDTEYGKLEDVGYI